MDQYPRQRDKSRSQQESAHTAEGYVLDGSSGLYVPKSDPREEKRNNPCESCQPRPPLNVKVRRDWIIILISVLTLFGLGLTVYFTKRQWHEANRSATAAENAISDERMNFVRDQRPYLAALPRGAFPNPINPDAGLVVEERNGRHAIAVNVILSDIGRTPAVEVNTTNTSYIVDEQQYDGLAAT